MRLIGFIIIALMAMTFVTAAEQEPWWEREADYALNYSKIPWILRGITPQLSPPNQEQYDLIRIPSQPPRLDPRTCPGEIAQCYEIREHNFTGEITGGKNYSAISSYVLPERRVKTTLCLGDDFDCVRRATNCFCLKETPSPPLFFGVQPKCSDERHLCRNTFGSFTLCDGNFTWCSEQNLVCGCGAYATCTGSRVNACLNNEGELVSCKAPLADCLRDYKTCFCGDSMMTSQKSGCDALRHRCLRDDLNVTCYGSFTECALRNDICECGSQ